MARIPDGLLEKRHSPRMLVLMHTHAALEGIW